MENENRNSRISNMNDFVNTTSGSSEQRSSRVAASMRTGSTPASTSASSRVKSVDVSSSAPSRVRSVDVSSSTPSRVRSVDMDSTASSPRRTAVTQVSSDETNFEAPQVRKSAPVSTSVRSSNGQPRKRRRKFTKLDKADIIMRNILVIYSVLMLIATIVACIILSSYVSSVAKGESTTVIETVAENFKSVDKLKSFIENNPDKVKSTKSIIGFDDKYYQLIDGKEISFISCDNTETTQAFYIQADNQNVALVNLKLSDEKGAMGVEKWEVDSIDTSVAFSDVKSYSILVPEGSTVYVNGVLLDDGCITGTGTPEILKNSVQYISNPPQFTTYTAKSLTDELVVTGTDANGADLVFSVTEDSYVAGGKADQTFIDSVKGVVEAGLKEYALYFIYNAFNLDLYIVQDSVLHDYIFGSDEYDPINPALYNYEWIKSFSFSEFSATNYTKYGDDCFTVDVKYKLDMVFDDDHPDMKDENQKLDATWVWVRDGDSWSISDSIVH